MKPKDIPQEVWDEASRVYFADVDQPHEWCTVIARAIMAAEKRENEACARLIEEGFDRAGIVTKNDQCPHNKYGWEDCEQCACRRHPQSRQAMNRPSHAVMALALLPLLATPAYAYKEIEVQQRYCAGMPINVNLPDRTEVDCLAGDLAIEVDFTDHWAAAIGQSLHYARVQTERLQAMKRPKGAARPAVILVCNENLRLATCREHLSRMVDTLNYWRIGMLIWFCDSRVDMRLDECDFTDLYAEGEFE